MTKGKILSLRLLLTAAMATTIVPTRAQAEVPGVSTLIQQGQYWQSKGRQDLANQAFRRALILDPTNGEARRGLAGQGARTNAKPAAPTPAIVARPAATPQPAQPTPRVAQPARTGNDARAAGFRALDDNQLDEAEELFTRAISRNRGDADAQGGLGLVRLRQGRFGEARDLLNQATRLGGPAKWSEALASAQFYGGLADARALLADGRIDQSQAQAEGLARSGFAQRGPALELLAEIYERQGRYADAADIYRQASEGSPEGGNRLRSRAARDRALQAAAQGDDFRAEQEFQAGLLLDQNDPWIRYEFARYLISKGRLPETESQINSLTNLATPDSLYAAALINADLGRLAAADKLIGRIPQAQRSVQMRNFAIGLKTDSAIERAKAMASQGQQGEALAVLRQLGATPGMPAVKQAAIADALYELGDGEAAASLAQQAMAGEIGSAEGYEPIVRVLAKTGRDGFANAAVQRATQMAGSSVDGQRTVARLNGIMAASQADRLRMAGQYAPAFDQLQAAWNAAPGNQEVLAALARLYQSGGLHVQAAQTYQLILAQSPDNKGALIGLIETAGAAGDKGLARQTIDRAIKVAPDDHEIYMAAARMEQARGDEGAAVKYLKRAREIYARQSNSGSGQLTSANPFAANMQGNNPFRNQAPAAAAPTINPFALQGGARMPIAVPTPAPLYRDQAYESANNAGQQPVPYQVTASPPTAFPGQAWQGSGAQESRSPSVDSYGMVSSDPVLASIQTDINALTRRSGPRADVQTGYRERSGETGLSALKEVTGSAEISTGLGNGRIGAKVDAVVLDSGLPTGSALARFGRNGTAEAQAIVDEEEASLTQAATQHASGVAISASYTSPVLQLEVGVTPLGFEDTEVTWRAAISPRFSPNATARLWAESKAVTDSVISYAGTRDPVTGQLWGQVMRTGGGLSFSYDREGAGVYGDAAYSRYDGTNVRRNSGVQVNLGGYMPFYRGDHSVLTGGVNVNYQSFDNNQNFFTFGHGGYFSPQSFLSVSFPVRYSYEKDKLQIRANAAPGYQSFSQDQVALYPTDPSGQGLLDSLKARNSDVRSFYDSISKTGFALSADGSIYYRVSPGTRVGGEIGINTFGTYDEFKSLIGIRQSLGGAK